MRSCRHFPRAPLSDFIHCLWYWEGAPKGHAKERLLPNGEFAVIFNLLPAPIRIYDAEDLTRVETYGMAVLSGARANCFAIDTDQQERVIGVQFRAGGAFPFLGMPATEAEGRSIDLDDVWPRGSRDIRERMLAADSVPEMLQTLETWLIQKLLGARVEMHAAVRYAVQEFQRPGAWRVDAVRDQTGLSSRRFIELFRREVGLTPKVFCRVIRFQQVLKTVHLRPEIDWADVALECGFYDQAHFIHDFQDFSGMTPTQYVAAASEHLNHVPLK